MEKKKKLLKEYKVLDDLNYLGKSYKKGDTIKLPDEIARDLLIAKVIKKKYGF